MRILMLSWEYPPKVVGGLARAVSDLSEALSAQGHHVVVLTGEDANGQEKERRNGVLVQRVRGPKLRPLNFLDSVLYLNYGLIEAAMKMHQDGWEWDVVHGHDWLVSHAASVLKHAVGKPLVATIHATEWGRNNGLHTDLQRHISDIEWSLAYEAYHVICCSHYMLRELGRVFQLPQDKVSVIPNGVNPEKFQDYHQDLSSFRKKYAHPDEAMVFFVGRLVNEKGVQVFLEAVPSIVDRCPKTKFVVAGTGPSESYLKGRCRELGVQQSVYFTGFVDDVTRNSLYRVASVAVFPSLYEPFGIVALEAMVAGTPVVTSDIGGFREIIDNGRNGLTSFCGNHQSLADSVTAILQAPDFAQKLRQAAYNDVVEKYSLQRIAETTAGVYKKVVEMGGGTASFQHAEQPVYPRYLLQNVHDVSEQIGEGVDNE